MKENFYLSFTYFVIWIVEWVMLAKHPKTIIKIKKGFQVILILFLFFRKKEKIKGVVQFLQEKRTKKKIFWSVFRKSNKNGEKSGLLGNFKKKMLRYETGIVQKKVKGNSKKEILSWASENCKRIARQKVKYF